MIRSSFGGVACMATILTVLASLEGRVSARLPRPHASQSVTGRAQDTVIAPGGAAASEAGGPQNLLPSVRAALRAGLPAPSGVVTMFNRSARSGPGIGLARAPEPPASPSALPDPDDAHGSDRESAAQKPVRDVLGYREKDDTSQNQNTAYQTRDLRRQQQDRPVRAVLRLVTLILLGRLSLLPPRHSVRKPALVREQPRTSRARWHLPVIA